MRTGAGAAKREQSDNLRPGPEAVGVDLAIVMSRQTGLPIRAQQGEGARALTAPTLRDAPATHPNLALFAQRPQEFQDRHGRPMPSGNVWLVQREGEVRALERIIESLAAGLSRSI